MEKEGRKKEERREKERVRVSTPMKNLRSYREMVGARYDHRLLLLVLPESCSLSLLLSLSSSFDDRLAIQHEDLSRSTEHGHGVLHASDKGPFP